MNGCTVGAVEVAPSPAAAPTPTPDSAILATAVVASTCNGASDELLVLLEQQMQQQQVQMQQWMQQHEMRMQQQHSQMQQQMQAFMLRMQQQQDQALARLDQAVQNQVSELRVQVEQVQKILTAERRLEAEEPEPEPVVPYVEFRGWQPGSTLWYHDSEDHQRWEIGTAEFLDMLDQGKENDDTMIYVQDLMEDYQPLREVGGRLQLEAWNQQAEREYELEALRIPFKRGTYAQTVEGQVGLVAKDADDHENVCGEDEVYLRLPNGQEHCIKIDTLSKVISAEEVTKYDDAARAPGGWRFEAGKQWKAR